MADRVPQQDPGSRARRRSLRAGIALVAVLGVVLTAGVAYAASHLVSKSIGLTSEPAELDRSLAPTPASSSSGSGKTTMTTTTVEARPQATQPPADSGSARDAGTTGAAGGRTVTQPRTVTRSPATRTEDATRQSETEDGGASEERQEPVEPRDGDDD